MADDTLLDFFNVLHSDLSEMDSYPRAKPLLAHYTSLINLENILKSKQIWMSNPLQMNDLEEVRFGVNHGRNAFFRNHGLRKAIGTDERNEHFTIQFNNLYSEFSQRNVLDLYVSCFSLHQRDDTDGRLSMWRGYGNNGNGAAIVFDTSKVIETDGSPIVLAKVEYAPSTSRLAHIEEILHKVAEFFGSNEVPTERIGDFAAVLFQRLTLFAIFSKHIGFDEEQEWRLAYLKDRDTNSLMLEHFDYFIGPKGIEPKLKLPIRPAEGVPGDGFEFSSLIDSIIIGPSPNPLVTQHSIERMLEKLDMAELKGRIKMSSIPFRAI